MDRPSAVRLAAVALALAAGAAAARADAPYQEAGRRKPWFSLLRPARATAAGQLSYARDLARGGHWIRASRHFRALVACWPSAPEAVAAQRELAEMLDARGKSAAAFEQYDVLLRRYGSSVDYQAVVRRQFEIAVSEKDREYHVLPGVGFVAPERALPMFATVVTNAPDLDLAPKAQLTIARIRERNDDLEEAVSAYTAVQYRFPASPEAAEAAHGRAACLYRLALRTPNDVQLQEDAWFAVDLFLRSHPDAAQAAEAQRWRDDLLRARVRRAYEKAVFYDRLARQPSAALAAYRAFLAEFPRTEWTETAKGRIEALQKLTGDRPNDEKEPPDNGGGTLPGRLDVPEP